MYTIVYYAKNSKTVTFFHTLQLGWNLVAMTQQTCKTCKRSQLDLLDTDLPDIYNHI